ncbi:hypothetical protein [Vibrio sp. LaRot3]|uniref:hypothetical protein n=1 Tax=Vibrio sp. LaRot3 TaxID=2998829 RepID=UPI0022CDCEA1|nr:hypothetical protein [Vibrio sp. LaRot3]MDA0149794.1 hypothetical protein [Vibrio sp. LaRot3]
MKKSTNKNEKLLSSISLDDLNEYSHYTLTCINQTAALANTGEWPDELFIHWNNSVEEVAAVKKSYLGETMFFLWEYAEFGLNYDEIKAGHYHDPLMQVFRWTSLCDAFLVHAGTFGNEDLAIQQLGKQLAYKVLARLKLDLNIDIEEEFSANSLFPLSHPTDLTTLEYALLAGFSHVGAVRNEICNKANPLKVIKEGNNSIIPIEEARVKLFKKRKFVPTRGLDYQSISNVEG